MKRALEISLLTAFFLTSAGTVWYGMDYRWKRINTPEVVAQRKVDKNIREDLCERLERDLLSFKETPQTFRRTTLRVLEEESRFSLRYLLTADGVPSDFPIEYKGTTSRFADCQSVVKKWLQIPSTDGEQLATEYIVTGVKAAERLSTATEPAENTMTALRNAKRLALVIGNASYENRPLANPVNDADDMATTLERLGFDVINLRNVKTEELRRGLEHYLKRLHSSDVGLVYFSGHGVEYAGRNYMLPIDFRANDEDEIPRQAVDLTILVDKVSKVNGKVNIIILDACRSSFVVSRGRSIAQGLIPMAAVSGTLIAYSTAPGSIALDGSGRNSPYTKNLLHSLGKPGVKIEDVFKETAKLVSTETGGRQSPWYSSSLNTDFSLN